MGEDGRIGPDELDALLDVASTGPPPVGAAAVPGHFARPVPPPTDDPPLAHTSLAPEAVPPQATTSAPATDTGALLVNGGDDSVHWPGALSSTPVRRRWLAAGLTVVTLLAALGALDHLRTGPSAASAAPAKAWYVPNEVDMMSVTIEGGTVSSQLYLQLPGDGPAMSVVGFTAQGLGPSSVTQHGSDVTVQNPLQCSTIGSLTALPQPAVLHLAGIDAWGREVTRDVPLAQNPGAAGIPASDAVDALRRACVGQLSDQLMLVGVRADRTPTGESLHLAVDNPTRQALLLLGAQSASAPADASIGDPDVAGTGGSSPAAVMAPGAVTTIALPVIRTDCSTRATTSSAGLGAGPGRRTGDFSLWVAPPGSTTDPRYDSWTALALTGPQRSSVAGALAAPCLGAPALSYVISGVQAGSPGSGTVTFLVRARAGAGSLRIDGDGTLGSLMAATVVPRSVGEGRLSAQVTLSYDYCRTSLAQLLPSPPVLSLVAQVGAAGYPYQVPVGSRTVLNAFGRACGQQPDLAQARTVGWDV